MRKSKFITLLRSLTPQELRQFDQYISYMYSGQTVASTLFKYIKKYAPDYQSERLVKEKAFSKIFGADMAFNNKRLGNVLSTLFAYLEDFLLQQRMKQNGVERAMQLLHIYKERRLSSLSHKTVTLADKLLQQEKQAGMWHFLHQMELNHLTFFHLNDKKLDLGIGSFEDCMNNLDLFFVLTKLKYACEKFNRGNILQEEKDIPFLEELRRYCREQGESLPMVHRMYAQMLDLLEQKELDQYQAVKQLFFENYAIFQPIDQLILLGYLANLSIGIVRRNNEEYLNELFSLYQFGIEKRALLAEGYISAEQFINVVIVACGRRDWDWLSWLLKKHTSDLLPDDRQNVVHLSNAYIAFYRKNFLEVIGNLAQVEILDPGIAFRLKALQLRAYYEQYGKHELVIDNAKTFELYLKRHKKMSEAMISAYLNFIKLLRKMMRKRVNKDQLIEEVEASKPLLLKKWLLDKIVELK
ncbi:MAG: hypothetical protein AAFV95_17415 [Bacteroidota bacterium]